MLWHTKENIQRKNFVQNPKKSWIRCGRQGSSYYDRGLRLIECIRLHVKDVDFENHQEKLCKGG